MPGCGADPDLPTGVVNRTVLPSGPSVTTRIETSQATSSRSSSVSHSRRLQLRTSIAAAKLETRAFAVEHVAHRRGEEPNPSTRGSQDSRRQRVGQRGDDSQIARLRGEHVERFRSQGRVTAAEADRQLIAELAAGDQQGPVGRVIGNANRVMLHADIGQPAGDRLACRIGFRTQSADRACRPSAAA